MGKKIMLGIFGVVCLMMALFSGCTTMYSQEDIDSKIAARDALHQETLDIEKQNAKLVIDTLNIEIDNRPTQTDLDALSATVTRLELDLQAARVVEAIEEKPIEETVTEPETEPVNETIEEVLVNEQDTYKIDELEIGETIANKRVSDRDVNTLFDDEIVFDGDNYDAEEILTLNGLKVEHIGTDYNGKTYVTIPTNGIEYTFKVEAKFDTALIDKDDTAVIKFLGTEIEIIDWSSNEITYITGDEYSLELGKTETINDKVITVTKVGEDMAVITVGDDTQAVELGDEVTIGGLDFSIVDIFMYNAPVDSGLVKIRVGNDTEVTIEDSEEYADDSIWEYVITDKSVGIRLIEEFMDIDDDEDYQALGVDKQLALPNDYAFIRYDGLTDEDMYTYTFRAVTKQSTDCVEVKGEFLNGITDYEKVYVDMAGVIYNDDLEALTGDIECGDSGVLFKTSGDYIIIEDVKVKLDFSEVLTSDGDIEGTDEDFLTEYGILVKDPEDAYDDEKLKIYVPEEQLEATIAIVA